MDVVVPTECTNNKGLPHCLEHLVFMGSQQYPQRGYLDKLANLCLAQVARVVLPFFAAHESALCPALATLIKELVRSHKKNIRQTA